MSYIEIVVTVRIVHPEKKQADDLLILHTIPNSRLTWVVGPGELLIADNGGGLYALEIRTNKDVDLMQEGIYA